jgi:hypothetical protein
MRHRGGDLTAAGVQVRGTSECLGVFPSSTPGLWLTLLYTPGSGTAWTVTHWSGYAVAGPKHNTAFGHGDEEAAFRAHRLGLIGVDWTAEMQHILRLPPDVLALVRDALLDQPQVRPTP